jgi:hypothetical protein
MARLSTKSILMYSFAIAALSASLATSATPAGYRPEDPAQALRSLQPALSAKKARRLAEIFVRTASRRDCQIPWQILASVAFNESSLGFFTENLETGDHGLMQINVRTINRLELDRERIKRDPSYAAQVGCRLIRWNRDAYAQDRPYWLGVYRSGNRFSDPTIVRNAERYARMILATAERLGYRPQFSVAFAE